MSEKAITIILQGSPELFPVIISNNGSSATGLGVSLDQIPEYVAAAAVNYSINNIKISGNAEFAQPIIEEILELSNTKYANTNLEIEVL